MAILVTGGIGFVGRYVVDQLARSGVATISYNRDFSESPHPAVRSVPAEVYAPGLRLPEILKDMVRAAAQREPFVLAEGRDHKFHFIHAEDAARAAILAANCPTPPQRIYNISGGRQITIGDVAGMVKDRV